MFTNLYRGAALLAALALSATPAISQAATAYSSSQPVHMNFTTSISSIVGFDYPYTGTLQLTFNPDGIINGYYRPADNNEYIPVTGGRNGKDVWLDIGRSGRLHINGQLDNGQIVGGAFDSTTNQQFKFTATPGK